MLKILWIEDDPVVTKAYPPEASMEGLDLVSYPCWDEGYEALVNEFDTWDAIILDAKCKKSKNDLDNATRFLSQALSDISKECTKRRHQICWYVLSAGSGDEEDQINDLINDDRLNWDRDWTERNNKKFYSKLTDRKILFKKIFSSSRRNASKYYQIRSMLYPDVFQAIEKCRLNEDVALFLTDLLFSLHYGVDSFSEKDNMWKIRKSLEYIFRAMIEVWGVLPQEFKVPNGKDQINLTWCKMCLAGKVVIDMKTGVPIGNHSYYSAPLYNSIMDGNIANIIEITGSYLHTGDGITRQYLNSVKNSPYLIRRMTLQLCDTILWFKEYITENPDTITNTKKWE